MKDIQKYILSKGGQELGVTWYDIERYILTPIELKRFKSWMGGQTVGCVDDSCKSIVVYTGDLVRFMKGLPNND